MANFTLTIPEKEFKSMIRQVLREQLKENKSTQTELENELITRKEACNILRISLPTLNNWTKEGILTAHKVGLRRVLYKRSEVLQALGDKRERAQNG